MHVGTKVGQSPGTKRVGLPQFSNRPYVVHASAGSCGVRWAGRSNRLQTEFEHFKRTVSQVHSRTVFQMLSGRIRSDGYSRIIQSACISVLRCHPGTSTFEQVAYATAE